MREKKVKESESKVNKTKRQVKTTKGTVDKIDMPVWSHLKKHLRVDEQIIYGSMEASCPAKLNGEQVILVRIFNPVIAKEKNIEINDYESLNMHPDLVLYEGYYTRSRKRQITIIKREEGKRSLLDAKLTSGEITEIGIIPKKTTAQKWLGGFGNFLMMGGFILILVLVVVLIILIRS